MRTKTLFSKALAAVLAVLMLFTLVPVMSVSADEATSGETQTSDDGLNLAKSVTVEDDGTYTIKLEAYATGTVTTNTTSKPCDIVLLLDQSGSMKDKLGTTAATGTYEKSNLASLTWSGAVIAALIDTLYYQTPDGVYVPVNITKEFSRSESGLFGGSTDYYYYRVVNAETGVVIAEKELTTGTALITSIDITLYTYTLGTSEISKQAGLQEAAVNFVKATAEKNANLSADQQHRISIVKFADDSYKDSVGDDKNSDGYNYTQIVASMTAVNEDTVNELVTKINNLEAAGATAADYGMNKAIGALGTLEEDGREKIIIMFTDGEPNHSNGFSTTVANSTISAAKNVKDKGVIVYTIGVFKDADPTQDPTLNNSDNFNKYLHAVSSNYPEATSLTALGSTGSYTNGYYKTASTAEELNSIFQEIQNSVGGTTVTLDSEAVLKDIISDSFVLPEGFTPNNNVTIQTADYNADGTFGTSVNATGCTVTVDGKTINVTGFSYKDNYCVVVDGKPQGKKLIVTITGIEVDPTKVVAGDDVKTNTDQSGIYSPDGNEYILVQPFERPGVKLASKSYVIDYAKSFTMNSSEWLNSVAHVAANTSKIATKTTNANFVLANGKVESSGGTYTYTPQTTSWNGYDSFYAFGTDSDSHKLWSSVNVIPANNVYYEDSFVSTTKATTDTGVDENSVQIVYNGNNTTSSGNDEKAEINESGTGKGIHGWEDSLADDTGYSDGSATKMTTGATATFTFTGTGVDIYSYTDMNTGIVTAKIKDESGAENTKYLMVDNLAVSGQYYQIPTLSFQDLAYGTYTVTLVVNNAKAPEENGNGVVLDNDGNIVYSETETRNTYYLDGIRVYNPIQNLENTDTVKNAYGANELNAVFEEVRDLMAENTDSDGDTGTVFIDLDGSGTVSDATAYDASEYGTYGPKNEVYLAPGQSIVFKVDGNDAYHYYIGMKAPAGATTAAFSNTAETNSGTEITHTTDLYYTVTPVNGYITVKNTGATNILSVTKVKMTGEDTTSGIMLLAMTEEEASNEIAAFSLRTTVAYTAEPEKDVTEETTPDEEIPEDTETEEPEIDVEIENPEPETEQKPNVEEVKNELNKLVTNLFKNIFKWFGRR